MGEPRLPVFKPPVSAGHVAMGPVSASSTQITPVDSAASVEGPSSVGQILERVCPCGGDKRSPFHQENLTHRSWLWRLAVVNMGTDPVVPERTTSKPEPRKGALQVAGLPLE